MLTFVVYYRIHLNLNLEASARQWPNRIPPWNHTCLWDFFHLRFESVFWIWASVSHKLGCHTVKGLGSGSYELHRLWRLIERSWGFIPKKRLIHSGANGFKGDNVPLSLRDTGYCRNDHEVSLPAWLTPAPFIASCFRTYKDDFMFTNLDWTQGDRTRTSSTAPACFKGEFPLQSKPLPSHPFSLLNTPLQYICV